MLKKRVSKISKEFTFNDFEKYINDIKNTLISKDQTSFKVLNVKNKIAMRTGNNKKIQNDDKIRIYPFGSNIPSIKYFEVKL